MDASGALKEELLSELDRAELILRTGDNMRRHIKIEANFCISFFARQRGFLFCGKVIALVVE